VAAPRASNVPQPLADDVEADDGRSLLTDVPTRKGKTPEVAKLVEATRAPEPG